VLDQKKTKHKQNKKRKRKEKKTRKNKTACAFPRSSLNLGVLGDKKQQKPLLNARTSSSDNPSTDEFHSFTGKGSPSN
jgi:hypothetical protein